MNAVPKARLRRFDSASAFLADPVRAVVSRRTFTLCIQNPERICAIHYGPGDPEDAAVISGLFPVVAHPALAERYDVFHDLANVGPIAEYMYAFVENFLRATIDVLARRVRRVAVVRAPGLDGAAIAGVFHQHIAPRLDARLCETHAEAYAWLGLTVGEMNELDALRAELAGPALLRRMRGAIERQLDMATLASIAVQLGISERTLQRQLSTYGTSFRDELVRARIGVAKTRLLETREKVESIALTLGFASTASFSTSFHKIVGVAPSAFRARNS